METHEETATIYAFPRKWDPDLNLRLTAKHFAVSESTMRRWVKAGAPHVRTERGLQFKLSDVESWVRGQS